MREYFTCVDSGVSPSSSVAEVCCSSSLSEEAADKLVVTSDRECMANERKVAAEMIFDIVKSSVNERLAKQ